MASSGRGEEELSIIQIMKLTLSVYCLPISYAPTLFRSTEKEAQLRMRQRAEKKH